MTLVCAGLRAGGRLFLLGIGPPLAGGVDCIAPLCWTGQRQTYRMAQDGVEPELVECMSNGTQDSLL